jgi:hypothetical protein
LRGEVGLLRRQTNELVKLRQENRRLQAQVAPAEVQTAEQAKLNNVPVRQKYAEAWMEALVAYAQKNRGQFPTSFEEADYYWPKEMEKSTDMTPDRFEILYHGSLDSLTNLDVIVFREKKLWQNPANGRWGRLSVLGSGFAQYGSVLPGTPDEAFSDWEKEHLPPTNGN